MFEGKTLIAFSLMTVVLCGCAASIHSFTDNATSARIVRMSGNKLAGSIWRLELDAQRHEKDGQASFSLFVVYSGPGFLAIEAGKSLVLTIDGRRTEVAGSGSARHREVLSPGLVEETAFYHDIDKELIRQIAYAKRITVEVRGANSVIQRHFEEKNFAIFKEFYTDIVLKDISSNGIPPMEQGTLHGGSEQCFTLFGDCFIIFTRCFIFDEAKDQEYLGSNRVPLRNIFC